MTQGKLEKEILTTASELGTLLTGYHFDEAWTVAGRLNSLFKSEDVIQLPADQLESIHSELKGYYATNAEVNRLQKRLVAKGHKLQELSTK
ncbi:hypothetical protein SAMN02910293_02222 [Streptococcus henryi]|uniref:Uncharacterized protein n=1 Tax=Streptococcus henryi TaxID=439219 RepID=A0A1G6DIH9_9STRE|nr:hypothetical protein [Streptococcus henryi]SDB44911.1 hypothetical protein SAMN02910293_02222 [Streptococcus henryi]